MTRSAQRAAPWPRLLLLAALLLGIVTMHTLGHPTESHAMEDAPAAHAVASGAHGDARHASPLADAAPAVEAPRPGTGMDPMSVCLAVLGALTLLFLGAGPAGSRDTAPLGGADRVPGRSGGARKDTAVILPKGKLTADFDADNPGLWMVHCHNVYHAEAGMMTVLGYQR